MKKYFYLKNEQQIGPFSYDELWNQKIAPKTMVWHEGIQDWKEASSIPEFANWFPKHPVAQKKRQQPLRKLQQPSRPIQMKPVTHKKSYRGIVGVSVFLISIVFIFYLYNQKSASISKTSKQKVSVNSKGKSSTKRSKRKNIQIFEIDELKTYTKESIPLNPSLLGNEIASFLGTARASFSDAKVLFMNPNASSRFQYLIDTYSETSIKVLLSGVVPSIKYQSLTSALVIFYNPWNDLVLITDWHLFQGELFINDIELVTADFLEYDGIGLGQISPLWARNPGVLPIEALTNSLKAREKLFNNIWGEMTGTSTWRKLLFCLSSSELLVMHQAAVAIRMHNHYVGMQNLLYSKSLKVLKKPFLSALKKLHSENRIVELLNEGKKTPDIVFQNFSIYPPETWKKASLQLVQKVPGGAFVFVTTPKLTKTFLSFYYKFNKEKELILNRIDWCTFDNEI